MWRFVSVQWQDPGSSYIWLSGKVTSNLSQIPNTFCLFLPEILNSGQSVSHDFQKRKFHVINHLSERSERTVIWENLELLPPPWQPPTRETGRWTKSSNITIPPRNKKK